MVDFDVSAPERAVTCFKVKIASGTMKAVHSECFCA